MKPYVAYTNTKVSNVATYVNSYVYIRTYVHKYTATSI